jgi:hypothetical protein
MADLQSAALATWLQRLTVRTRWEGVGFVQLATAELPCQL